VSIDVQFVQTSSWAITTSENKIGKEIKDEEVSPGRIL
jgi:hypothetical protein